MSKVLSLTAIILSILIGVKYFKIYDTSNILPYNLTMFGALLLIAIQIFSYLRVASFNRGTTFMGKLIKTILAIPGVLYVTNMIYPINIGVDLEIFIALFLFVEGLYGLH